ncbi:MAG: ParB family transcriptional regulator, chromosome partitioning protein [Verrucomicrobiota bacterium]|jgi:ParB/RepB/Spo0J family partition protein
MTALVWVRPRSLTLRRVPISKIDLPEEYERKELAEDDAVGRSIKQHGVQQPVIVLQNGDRFTMVKGGRRLRLAEKAGFTDLLASIETVPAGWDELAYRNRLRFILSNARQDLPPSQKAAVIRQLMELTSMSQKDVAALMGFDPGSLSLWLVVETYAPPIRAALDAGLMNSHQATAFQGMTTSGMEKVFRAMRRDIPKLSGDAFQAMVRSRFGPKEHGDLYIDPKKSIQKLQVKKRGRVRKPLTRDEKRVLANSLELAEIELADLKVDNQRMKRECVMASPLLNAIKRNKRLWAMASEDMRFEIDTFLERY